MPVHFSFLPPSVMGRLKIYVLLFRHINNLKARMLSGCDVYYGALRVEYCLALCSRVVLFSIVITSLWEERAGLCAFRAFACLLCMR